MADRVHRHVISLGSNLYPTVTMQAGRPHLDADVPPDSPPHHDSCCCACCKPPFARDPHDGDRPSGDGRPPHIGRPDDPGTHDPGADHPGGGRPGSTGVPGHDGGTVVGNGGRVDRYPPPNVRRPPCGRGLFYTVDDLRRVGAYVLASSAKAQHVALLSDDVNLLNEWHFGKGGATLLTTASAPVMLAHVHKSGQWLFHNLRDLVAYRRSDLDLFPVVIPETKTFIGQQTYAMSYGQPESPKEIKALLLPIVEGGQTFWSPNLNGLGGFVNNRIVPHVRDFYDENSFGALKDVSIKVFGVDADLLPGRGPLKLPRQTLQEYFWPAYVPARVDLIKNITPAITQVDFDGRETLTLDVQPRTGGTAKGTQITLKLFALGFVRDDPNPVSQVKFLGNETLTLWVTMPDGSNRVLTLSFSAKTFDLATELTQLENYLDAAMEAARTAAGITTRLFATPKARRIRQIGPGFGRLLVTFAAETLTGAKLRVTGSSSSHPDGDPMGLNDPMRGGLAPWDTHMIARVLENAALVAQDDASIPYNDRRLNMPKGSYAGTNLVTSIEIADLHGGPGASVAVASSTNLTGLFDSSTTQPNSATTKNDAATPREFPALCSDAFSAATHALRDAGQSTDILKGFGCVIVMPLEAPAASTPPGESWAVSALYRPPGFDFRGFESYTTAIDRKDKKVQLQSAWTLIFMNGGAPDIPLITHELGHAIGMGDLYYQDGYRDELAYLEAPPGDNTASWAMMGWHPPMSHHCGYHKLQLNWIDDGLGTPDEFGRVYPLPLPDPSHTYTREMLLVPIEMWRHTLPQSARAAFGVTEKFPVVQLGRIELGGDGSMFGLIEARQPGPRFSKHLPGGGGVVITNCISWLRDERIILAGRFRRCTQLLNPDNVLRNPGEAFDLAFAPELAVKGLKVEVTDRKTVEGDVQVYRVKVTRENAEFADLYFDPGNPYWKSPDLWVDWMGTNLRDSSGKPIGFSDKKADRDIYGLGQPTNQGEKINVQPAGAVTPDNKPKTEPHWVVGRVRNHGTIKAINVKIYFYYFDPPGAGDAGKPMNILNLSKYKFIDYTIEEVLGRDDPGYGPKDVMVRWDVPPGFGGHTCLYVHIQDADVEHGADGAVLGTPDLGGMNNAAQKNVDDFEVRGGSPFDPVEFDFSVHNEGPSPEQAYLEPEGLPYGMELTVSPPLQLVAPGATAIFHCTLQLDERIIRTGCENDQNFRIHAWRQDAESSARWGGVEYQVRPRERTKTQLGGSWDYGNKITLKGKVTPAPGGGVVRIRLDYQGNQAIWVSTHASPIGEFTWTGTAPTGSGILYAIASFEGNRKFASSLSDQLMLTAYPLLH